MAFIPPVPRPSELDTELAHAEEREIEAKAERYAQLHADDVRSDGPIRRLIHRARAALRRGD